MVNNQPEVESYHKKLTEAAVDLKNHKFHTKVITSLTKILFRIEKNHSTEALMAWLCCNVTCAAGLASDRERSMMVPKSQF